MELIEGAKRYQKVSYPLRYGIYSELTTRDYVFHFNLNLEIIRMWGRGQNWPHRLEWLKRTITDTWVYYSTGGYTGVFETIGEHYLPNFPYPTNNQLGGTPFAEGSVKKAIEHWYPYVNALQNDLTAHPEGISSFSGYKPILPPAVLKNKGRQLRKILTGHISVLPPDTRHVDYNVIPLIVADGCRHKCGFCKVKNQKGYRPRSRKNIEEQLRNLHVFFDNDLINQNALFLGEHDALGIAPEDLLWAIDQSVERLALNESYMQGTFIFLFGSVYSFLNCPDQLFDNLQDRPVTTYINIGLESASQATLDQLQKPLKVHEVLAAFDKARFINQNYPDIEISLNFVFDESLPKEHFVSLEQLTSERVEKVSDKGSIYLSPLRFDEPSRSRLFYFYQLKRRSRLPLFLYTIQKL